MLDRNTCLIGILHAKVECSRASLVHTGRQDKGRSTCIRTDLCRFAVEHDNNSKSPY